MSIVGKATKPNIGETHAVCLSIPRSEINFEYVPHKDWKNSQDPSGH